MTNKKIKMYEIGGIYFCPEYVSYKYAIRVKDVPDIEEARKIIIEFLRKFKNELTDEEYIKKFGHEKVVITKEEKTYVRNTRRWIQWEDDEDDCEYINTYETSKKGGRGSMLCWVFYIEDRDVIIKLNTNKDEL